MRKIFINVKPEHFVNSTGYCAPSYCPFALAAKEHFETNNVRCSSGELAVNHVDYEVDAKWDNDPEIEANLFVGTIFEGLFVDLAIAKAKELAAAGKTEEIPTIKVWIKEKVA